MREPHAPLAAKACEPHTSDSQTPRSDLFSACHTRSGVYRTSWLLPLCGCRAFGQSAGQSLPSHCLGPSAHKDNPIWPSHVPSYLDMLRPCTKSRCICRSKPSAMPFQPSAHGRLDLPFHALGHSDLVCRCFFAEPSCFWSLFPSSQRFFGLHLCRSKDVFYLVEISY